MPAHLLERQARAQAPDREEGQHDLIEDRDRADGEEQQGRAANEGEEAGAFLC